MGRPYLQLRLIALVALIISLFAAIAQANVEKTIFLAPPATTVPSEEPDLDDLGLERLSPQSPILRAHLNASFPTASAPDGTDSWFFLENLTPGQRYEVRVCWLATQPTAFSLQTYSLTAAIANEALLASLSAYSGSRLAALDAALQANAMPRRASAGSRDPGPVSDSVLFLRVRAAADYFSLDEALMRAVPPVAVDLVLDPFLWNVFPRSLVPTAGWIVIVGAVAVVVARWVAGEIGRVIEDGRNEREVEEKESKKVR
ncbi:hypothetical protein N7462_009022 [Penicillium macrosclerotiorum]|uniref:uncharacterized protein n=1 Tax=Penicillium macrosclerotiorum TaxID=303699 RepID=UPI0025481E5B|nr:uncharacterized protein N7462_009022 [Penicillium macrosclerotiorum]KAJ5676125.1 hypothetical protein N7462_009022 [Penicillium macrosclerotiorum]